MAALNYLNNKRLRACSLKRFGPGAKQSGALLKNAAGGERTHGVPPPQEPGPVPLPPREVRVLAGFGLDSSSSLTRAGSGYCFKYDHVQMSVIGKSIHTTEASLDEEQVTDCSFKEVLSSIQNDPTSSQEICASFLNKLCRAGNLSSASKFLGLLHSKDIFLGHNTYCVLLATASEKNSVDLSSQIFMHLVVSHESLSSASYLNIAKAFGETSDCKKLLSFITEVSELAFPRSTSILNRIIFSFGECRQIDKAVLIFNHMKSLKCKPDLITYNTILDILGRFGRMDEMFSEFAAMKEEGIAPDIVSYNTLLNSLCKMGRFDLCSTIKKEMDGSGVEPDLLTYTALIETFGRSGNIEQSLRLFNEMKLRQIRPSSYIYKSLISNLKKMGKVELAMILLEEVESSLSELAGPRDFKRKNHR